MANGGSGRSTSGSAVAPVAHVAPGSAGYNLLCGAGIAGMVLGDFERNGVVNHSDAEYLVRVTRPGAIVLANLDITDLGRVPAPPPADMATILDASDARVNGPADEAGMTLIKVRKPDPCSATASRVVIRTHADDARRVRIFQVGASPDPILGPGKPAGPAHEFEILAPTPPNPWAFDYRVEALTLPGDPVHGAPTGASPGEPSPYLATLPAGSSGSPIYSARAPADVWLEIVHQTSGGADVPVPRDVAVVTIAPFMLLSNLHRLQQAFVVYFDWNHEFVYDLAEGLAAALGGITLPPDTSTRFVPHRPPYDPARTAASTPGNLYIVDGARFNDPWIQDEMEIGYCWAPHDWMHVVLHCKRHRPLRQFLHKEMPAPRVGLFDGLDGTPRDGQDYGGNLEVSPPVETATPALPRDESGPSVKAHRAAHFGKIIIGDCTPRPLHADFHRFLVAQKVQPVLPLDTSWLEVGHVDEIMSFVRSSTGRGFLLLFASVRAMTALLTEAERIPLSAGRTHFHRGKYQRPGVPATYAETSVEEYLHGPVGAYSDTVRSHKLIPIQQRLTRGLHLRAEEIIPFPTYFKLPADPLAPLGDPDNQTIAETVGSVNLLSANNHLMVPRPFGPRLEVAQCTTVLRRALDALGMTSVAVRLPVPGFWFWAEPGETLGRLAKYFVRAPTAADRANLIANIKGGPALSPGNAGLASAMEAAISGDARNTAPPALSTVLSPPPTRVFATWRRVWIPEPTVDLIEAYMLSVLEPHGLTLHFIDDFHSYHIAAGEVHCGTNARREPPEVTSGRRWWDDYDPDYDVTYDPAG